MVATFSWVETNAGAVEGTPTNLNFGSYDDIDIDKTAYPVTAGTNSFEKYILGQFDGIFAFVSQIRFWMSGGTLGSTESILTSAIQSGYIEPTLADPLETASTKAINAIPTSRPTNPNVGIGGNLSGTITAPGERTDYIVLQLQVSASAEAGSLSSKTLTLEWLEV
jgi:hypothetical protein